MLNPFLGCLFRPLPLSTVCFELCLLGLFSPVLPVLRPWGRLQGASCRLQGAKCPTTAPPKLQIHSAVCRRSEGVVMRWGGFGDVSRPAHLHRHKKPPRNSWRRLTSPHFVAPKSPTHPHTTRTENWCALLKREGDPYVRRTDNGHV